MPDPIDAPASTEKLNEQNAAEIRQEEATQHGPRGNVHSEAEEHVEQDMPPPLPN
ncbi:hypothetical protein [Sphingomonas bacterium]|uniref:hypothetical protein n=1 Tax=Sphingomonas bacterium TaxID=1895847 RepID=UPI001576BD8E|nr:hypothetical protein [Sphingomonas bacterium]